MGWFYYLKLHHVELYISEIIETSAIEPWALI